MSASAIRRTAIIKQTKNTIKTRNGSVLHSINILINCKCEIHKNLQHLITTGIITWPEYKQLEAYQWRKGSSSTGAPAPHMTVTKAVVTFIGDNMIHSHMNDEPMYGPNITLSCKSNMQLVKTAVALQMRQFSLKVHPNTSRPDSTQTTGSVQCSSCV